jgi:hypothetical protein
VSTQIEQQGNIGDRREPHEIVLGLQHRDPSTEVRRIDGFSFSCLQLRHHPVPPCKLDMERHEGGTEATAMGVIDFEFETRQHTAVSSEETTISSHGRVTVAKGSSHECLHAQELRACFIPRLGCVAA